MYKLDRDVDLSLLTKYLGEAEPRTPVLCVQTLAVLPVSNLVLIPGNILPVHIVEERHVNMIHELVKHKQDLAVCFAPFGRDSKMMMSGICGAGRVIVVDAFHDGRRNVIIEGDYRVEILDIVEEFPHLKARVRWVPDTPYADLQAAEQMHASFLDLVKRWLFLMGHVPPYCYSVLDFFHYPHELSDFIGSYFLPDFTLKQRLLETVAQEKRVKMVEEILNKGIDWFSEHPSEYHLEHRQ